GCSGLLSIAVDGSRPETRGVFAGLPVRQGSPDSSRGPARLLRTYRVLSPRSASSFPKQSPQFRPAGLDLRIAQSYYPHCRLSWSGLGRACRNGIGGTELGNDQQANTDRLGIGGG